MTTIDINQLTPEQRAELLKNIPAEELKAGIKAQEQSKDEDRKAYKDTVNETIPMFVGFIAAMSAQLSETKKDIFEGMRHLLDLKMDAFEVKQGQQSHTFSDDQGNGICYGYRVVDGWDDTVNAGIDKINAFIQSLAKDENSAKAVAGLNKLLKKDAKGNLKSSRVLEMRQMAEEFNDAGFTDGVDIIQKSYKPVRSAFFIEAWSTNSMGKKVYYPLSISSVDFPEGTVIEDLFPLDKTESDVAN